MHAYCVIRLLFAVSATRAQRGGFDIVIRGGCVSDPESHLDAVRNIGIRHGRIAAISTASMRGAQTIDAAGLVVLPGFIDLHAHSQDDENYRVFVLNGVTTARELEAGTADVPVFYQSRVGKALINYDTAASHIKARMVVMHDGGVAAGTFLPLDSAGHVIVRFAQIVELRRVLDAGPDAGGLGVGMGVR